MSTRTAYSKVYTHVCVSEGYAGNRFGLKQTERVCSVIGWTSSPASSPMSWSSVSVCQFPTLVVSIYQSGSSISLAAFIHPFVVFKQLNFADQLAKGTGLQ